MAFDIKTIKSKGVGAFTNFNIALYNVEEIMAGEILQINEEMAQNYKQLTQQHWSVLSTLLPDVNELPVIYIHDD